MIRRGIGVQPYTVGATPFIGLLDTYTDAAAAYSVRKLRAAYTGSAIRVRRSSDNTEQDIGFDTNNNLDESALTTFVGANNGFVTTWYDQSGNSRNATQSTAANQPQIVSSGSVLKLNNKPRLQLDGSNDFLQVPTSKSLFKFLHDGTNSAIFCVNKFGNSSNPNAIYVLIETGITTSDIGLHYGYDDRSIVPRNNAIAASIANANATDYIARITGDNNITPNIQVLTSLLISANASPVSNRIIAKVNNNADISNNVLTGTASTSNSTYDFTIGRSNLTGGLFYMLGDTQELIVWGSNQTSNKSGISTDINTYYSIY